MNVAIYARAASKSGSSVTIDKQINECMKFAEDNGHEVVGKYSDVGVTHTNADLTEFARMIGELESQKVQGVLVSSYDRFSRSRKDAMETKKVIEKYGIETISVMCKHMPDKVMHSLLDVYKERVEKKRKKVIRK